jgi:hypothetical protein
MEAIPNPSGNLCKEIAANIRIPEALLISKAPAITTPSKNVWINRPARAMMLDDWLTA